MITGIFFDGGGVISHFDEGVINEFELRWGLQPGAVVRSLYSGPEWMDAELGAIDEDSWFAAGLRRLPGSAGSPTLQDLRAAWEMSFLRLDDEMVTLAESLTPSYRVGLLTNSSSSQPDLERKLASIGILHIWHAIVNSASVGVAKPDVRIYQIAAREIGLSPSECVHIDDKPENVAGAQAAGFHALHHSGSCADLAQKLRALGIDC